MNRKKVFYAHCLQPHNGEGLNALPIIFVYVHIFVNAKAALFRLKQFSRNGRLLHFVRSDIMENT